MYTYEIKKKTLCLRGSRKIRDEIPSRTVNSAARTGLSYYIRLPRKRQSHKGRKLFYTFRVAA